MLFIRQAGTHRNFSEFVVIIGCFSPNIVNQVFWGIWAHPWLRPEASFKNKGAGAL
jgi:hypothetical protein